MADLLLSAIKRRGQCIAGEGVEAEGFAFGKQPVKVFAALAMLKQRKYCTVAGLLVLLFPPPLNAGDCAGTLFIIVNHSSSSAWMQGEYITQNGMYSSTSPGINVPH